MKKVFIFLAALLAVFTVWFYWKNPLITRIRIHNHTFLVDVAVTPKEKELGLGNRDRLASDRGMLFLYDHREQYGFWMKNMRFPLDFVWIAGKTVISLDTDVPPPTSPNEQLNVYRPPIPVDKVLELPAGTVKQTGITIGDTIEILR